MKILGIGNAIVDVICKVEDKYLSDNDLREEIAKNGFQRCYKSEYSNDNMLDKCLNNILKNRG